MVFQDDIDALFPGLYHCICYFRPERSQPARTQNEFRSVTDKYHYKERVLPVIFSRAKKKNIAYLTRSLRGMSAASLRRSSRLFASVN